MSDTNATRVLRRTLEESLGTHTASTVLFEALGASARGVPRTLEDVMHVVNGPLKTVLAQRLDPDSANQLIARLGELLEPEDPSTVELSLDDLVEQTSREDATAAFPTIGGPVRVLIIASSNAFELKLALALGENRVAPKTVAGAKSLEMSLMKEIPAILVLDATDFPAVDHRALLTAAMRLPKTTSCVLFGSELPYGRSFAKRVSEQDRHWVTLERREGVAPLLDLIRSRRRPLRD